MLMHFLVGRGRESKGQKSGRIKRGRKARSRKGVEAIALYESVRLRLEWCRPSHQTRGTFCRHDMIHRSWRHAVRHNLGGVEVPCSRCRTKPSWLVVWGYIVLATRVGTYQKRGL